MAPNTAVFCPQQLRHSYIEISKYICRNSRALSTFNRSPTCLYSQETRHFAGRQHKLTGRTSRGQSSGRRCLSHGEPESIIHTFKHSNVDNSPFTLDWSEFDHLGVTDSETGVAVSLHGYVTSHRSGKQVDFLTLVDPTIRRAIQVVAPKNALSSVVEQIGKLIEPHTPVQIRGTLVKAQSPPKKKMIDSNTFVYTDQYVGAVKRIGHIDVMAANVTALNEFPHQLVAKNDTNFPPEMRHLSIRTSSDLRHALRARSKVKNECSKFFLANGFDDVETPLLFKSTPEGAREFVVPTRKKGLAYALPQSPQQYKQVLMASGVHRYFQFAKCFRDEDMRADRQPEFTQLDLEMSFANSQTVMSMVERLILCTVWPVMDRSHKLEPSVRRSLTESNNVSAPDASKLVLPVFTYHEVMANYGSDKPDPRLGAQIVRIEHWVPDSLRKMLTDINDPIIELIKITTTQKDPRKTRDFMASFMGLPTSETYIRNPDGMVGISIYDPNSPLRGLAAFGHEAAAEVEERFEPDEGDILVVMCRPNKAFEGGSTMLGNLRRDLLRYAVEQELVDMPTGDSLIWVTDFPLFSPMEDQTPGQEGEAGICSTHHPFTAPRNDQDLLKLLTDPLSVIGDHYDLVINGVEVGGGSRRIHLPQMQELIFRQILKMKIERVEDFRHLLDALGAGCPPHAGFALGFDRLMTLLLDQNSVRDVIAFPKYGDGEDRFVGSPSQLTPSQLNTYHLKVSDEVQASPQTEISVKA